ncbi:TetR/AcrR family transcriptional regulator [Mycolicibacterium boenickei]|nr:TetR/AcrR family transcriptional regulator [Mycolicibacterium boenickei]
MGLRNMPDVAGEQGGRAARRSGLDSRRLILAAARHLFVERGYASTGTRDIAAASHVPERLIFRHFGTKRQLFYAAARAELAEFLDTFVEQWRMLDPASYDFEDLTTAYVSAFLDFSETHDVLFADLISLRIGTRTEEDARPSPFADLLGGLENLATVEARRHGLPEDGARRNVNFTFALVVAAGLLRNVLGSDQFGRDGDRELVGQLTHFILGGALNT